MLGCDLSLKGLLIFFPFGILIHFKAYISYSFKQSGRNSLTHLIGFSIVFVSDFFYIFIINFPWCLDTLGSRAEWLKILKLIIIGRWSVIAKPGLTLILEGPQLTSMNGCVPLAVLNSSCLFAQVVAHIEELFIALKLRFFGDQTASGSHRGVVHLALCHPGYVWLYRAAQLKLWLAFWSQVCCLRSRETALGMDVCSPREVLLVKSVISTFSGMNGGCSGLCCHLPTPWRLQLPSWFMLWWKVILFHLGFWTWTVGLPR